MKEATVIRVTLRAVTVDASVAPSPSRLRTEIAAGIAEALARPAGGRTTRPGSLGARVGQAVAARLAEDGWCDAPPRDPAGGALPEATSDGGRDGH